METEAWLNGDLERVSPMLMPAAHALVEARKDIEKTAKNLSVCQLAAQASGAPSAAFHLKHIAGSIDRLLTYARGENLNAAQFAELAHESESSENETAERLTLEACGQIEKAVEYIRAVDEKTLFEKRVVGRKKLPTSVFGLLFHIAEHTQRHAGQFKTTARIVSNNLTNN